MDDYTCKRITPALTHSQISSDSSYTDHLKSTIFISEISDLNKFHSTFKFGIIVKQLILQNDGASIDQFKFFYRTSIQWESNNIKNLAKFPLTFELFKV